MAANEVRLYESDSPLGPWRLKRVLLEGVRAADICYFRHEDKDWISLSGGDFVSDVFSEFNLFYSDDILEDTVQAHLSNPISIYGGSERNAGSIIFDGNDLLRVSQLKDFDSYGDGLIFKENRFVRSTKLFRQCRV